MLFSPLFQVLSTKSNSYQDKSQIKFWNEGIASSALTPFPFFWQWNNIFLRLLISASVSATPWESCGEHLWSSCVFQDSLEKSGDHYVSSSTDLMPKWLDCENVIFRELFCFSHSTWHLFVIDLIFYTTPFRRSDLYYAFACISIRHVSSLNWGITVYGEIFSFLDDQGLWSVVQFLAVKTCS